MEPLNPNPRPPMPKAPPACPPPDSNFSLCRSKMEPTSATLAVVDCSEITVEVSDFVLLTVSDLDLPLSGGVGKTTGATVEDFLLEDDLDCCLVD